jgi:hypothetical protein
VSVPEPASLVILGGALALAIRRSQCERQSGSTKLMRIELIRGVSDNLAPQSPKPTAPPWDTFDLNKPNATTADSEGSVGHCE